MIPARRALSKYVAPAEETGHRSSIRSSAGQPYRLSPATVPWVTSFEFQHEAKDAIDRVYRDAVSASVDHLYTWEQLWSDNADALYPMCVQTIGSNGTREVFAFDFAEQSLDYSAATHKRRDARDDVRFVVHVDAVLRQSTASPTRPARAIY
jgi:hypothetical protein